MNAAVAAGVAAAGRIGNVYAWKVIARTATGIDNLIASRETYGVPPSQQTSPQTEVAPLAVEPEPEAMTIPVVTVEDDVQEEEKPLRVRGKNSRR